MPVYSFLAMSPGAVRGTAETVDKNDIRRSVLKPGISNFVKAFGIRNHKACRERGPLVIGTIGVSVEFAAKVAGFASLILARIPQRCGALVSFDRRQE